MALGSTPTIAEILDEIQESLPYTFPSTKDRWLADVGTSDPITFPTDFANKISVKVVDTVSDAIGGSSQHTFTGVSFGAEFTGRVLVACIGLYHADERVLNQTSCTIDGNATTGGDAGEALGGGPSCGAGIWAVALDSGTSGDVFLDWTSQAASGAGLIMLSISGISATPSDQTTDWTGTSQTLDIPSNGVLITSHIHANGNTTTMTGVTKREEITVGGATFCVGFDNRMDSETGRTVSASFTGSTASGGEGRSYQQS